MAKYLGGIEDSNIEIVGISQHFFSSGFDIQYYNYQLDTLAVQKLDIAKSLVKVEEVSAEIHSSPNRSATGALVGYLAGGPVWGIIGAALSMLFSVNWRMAGGLQWNWIRTNTWHGKRPWTKENERYHQKQDRKTGAMTFYVLCCSRNTS